MAGRKRGHPADIIKMLTVFASYSVIYFFNMAVSMGTLVCMISVIVLLTLAARYLGMEKKAALFMGVVFFCIRNLSSLAVVSVNFYIIRYCGKGADAAKVLQNTALNFFMVELLQFMLFFVLLYMAAHEIKKCRIELHIGELCYLLLAPVTGILFVNILFRILTVVAKGDLIIRPTQRAWAAKAETQVHGALKAAYYDAFRAARQEINSGVAGMEVQGGFDARA